MSLSSTQTRAAGKGGGGRGDKSSKASHNIKQNSSASAASDHHTQHKANENTKPQATAEQFRIAQLISDGKYSDSDPELQAKVTQVMELTDKSFDEVVVALHDCDNDVTKAVNMLLEGVQHQGEWETSGKKKKNRQNVAPSKQANHIENTKNDYNVNNKENRNNKQDRNHDFSKDKENSRNRGPPRLNRGKGWRGRENEKNAKNLDDGAIRSSAPQRGGRAVNGRGGRGGRGGSRSRTFENKSAPRDSFPRSIDTWTNSTAEQADPNAPTDSTMTVGNWADFKTEDWSDEIDDWNENLNETKVFTPSATTGQQPTDANINNTQSESVNLASLLQKPAPSNNIENSTIMNHSNQSPYISQYQQKASETIKSVVGVTSSVDPVDSQPSAYSVGQNLNYRQNMAGQKYQNSVGQQPTQNQRLQGSQPQMASRTKPQRTRLPPPSKIPASAVEMPDDSVGSLDVQFGGLEFGTESSGFDLSANTDSANHYNVPVSPASSLANHLSSSATQSLLSSSADAFNSSAADLGGNAGQISTSSSQSLLNQTKKLGSNAADSLLMSSQSSENSSAFSNPRTSQPPGMEVGDMGGNTKTDPSVLSGFGTTATAASVLHQNTSNLPFQSNYKNSSSLISSSNNSSSNYSSLPSQKSYNQNSSTYAQPSSLASSYSVDQSDQSVYSASDQTSNYQSQYQQQSTGAYQPPTSYSSATYSASNSSASTYGNNPKISLASDSSSLNQNTQNTYDSSVVSSAVDTDHSGVSSSSGTAGANVSLSASSMNASGLGLSTNSNATAAVTTSIASNSAALKTSLASGKSIPGLPPGVPLIGHHHPLVMSQPGLPFYASYYDIQYPTNLTAGREASIGGDGKYNRGDSNSSPIPTSLSQQQQQQQPQQSSSQQPYLSHTAAAIPPAYGNYYYVGGLMPGSFPQYSSIYPVPSVTNAHGATPNSQFQKPGAYQSHSFSSASGVSGGSTAGSDIGGSVYNKAHNQLSKSQFDKPGFHAGTPPPYTLGAGGGSGTAAGAGHQASQGGPMHGGGGTAGAPGAHYTPNPYMPMMTQHHLNTAMLHNLQQPDNSSTGSSQRSSNQNASSQQKASATTNKFPNFWPSS